MKTSPLLWSMPCLAIVGTYLYNIGENFPSLSLFLAQNGF